MSLQLPLRGRNQRKPEVKINLDEARRQITEEVKKSTKEDLQKSINKLGEGLKKLFK